MSRTSIAVTYTNLETRVLRYTEAIEAFGRGLEYTDDCDILVPWEDWNNYNDIFKDADQFSEYYPDSGVLVDLECPREVLLSNNLSQFLKVHDRPGSLCRAWLFDPTGRGFYLAQYVATERSTTSFGYQLSKIDHIDSCEYPELIEIVLRRYSGSPTMSAAIVKMLTDRLEFLTNVL